MAWKSDGTQLATVSKDSKVRVHDPRSQVSPIQVLKLEFDVFFSSFLSKHWAERLAFVSSNSLFEQQFIPSMSFSALSRILTDPYQ